jgi:hypothetical protein
VTIGDGGFADGEVVRRSAGYEHLVALSLIAALQDSAAVRGPALMDLPVPAASSPLSNASKARCHVERAVGVTTWRCVMVTVTVASPDVRVE